MVTFTSGKHYFLKVVNQDNFVADWLFKAYRRIVYRRLEDEVPFLSPKRQIEHESYIANLAYANGIRTPKIIGILEVQPNNWAQLQEAIGGKSLDKIEPARISDAMLGKTFELINHLHTFHIIHRDLRAANIFIDSNDMPWLIDFGFAEAAAKPSQTYRDLVEIVCSLGVIVGTDRIIRATLKNIPHSEIVQSLPYMQYACLSGETTRLIKQNKNLLPQIVERLKIGTQQETLKSAKVTRFG
jgi:undecaprenyl-diphosphatase